MTKRSDALSDIDQKLAAIDDVLGDSHNMHLKFNTMALMDSACDATHRGFVNKEEEDHAVRMYYCKLAGHITKIESKKIRYDKPVMIMACDCFQGCGCYTCCPCQDDNSNDEYTSSRLPDVLTSYSPQFDTWNNIDAARESIEFLGKNTMSRYGSPLGYVIAESLIITWYTYLRRLNSYYDKTTGKNKYISDDMAELITAAKYRHVISSRKYWSTENEL